MANSYNENVNVNTDKLLAFSENRCFSVGYWNEAICFKISPIITGLDNRIKIDRERVVRATTSAENALAFIRKAKQVLKEALETNEEKFIGFPCAKVNLISLEVGKNEEGKLIPYFGIYQDISTSDKKPKKYDKFPLTKGYMYFDKYNPSSGEISEPEYIENGIFEQLCDAVEQYANVNAMVHACKKALGDTNVQYCTEQLTMKAGIPIVSNVYRGKNFSNTNANTNNNNSGGFDYQFGGNNNTAQKPDVGNSDMSGSLMSLVANH